MTSPNLREYQKERIRNIREWYDEFCGARTDAPSSDRSRRPVIDYIVLWAVFNALYNVADLPKKRAKKESEHYRFEVRRGYRLPCLTYRKESTKLGDIAKRLARADDFSVNLIANHWSALEELSQRRPDVRQPDDVDQEIDIVVNGGTGTFDLMDIRGIASIDERVLLDDGLVLYRYACLDFELDDQDKPRNRDLFYGQLIFLLYQLRNNVVHGGSAAISGTKKDIAARALPILETIVQYLFDHPELLVEPVAEED